METQISTPVEIVQEFIAMHTTHREAIDKLTGGEAPSDLTSEFSRATQQSDQFIRELMNELSNYGDGVQAGIDRENEYQMLWKKSLEDINPGTAGRPEQVFGDLQENLKKRYQSIIETKTDLPPSLLEILKRHANKLQG